MSDGQSGTGYGRRWARIYQGLLLGGVMSLCAACGPTYQSVRAYIPHHEKPHQVRVDANLPLQFKADHYATQVDVSYSVDESLLVAVGGHSMKGYSCGTVRDEYHGVHFGRDLSSVS